MARRLGRLAGLASAAGALLLITATADAVVPRIASQRRVVADTLTAMPAANAIKPLRTHRSVRFAPQPTKAWQRFEAAAGGRWRSAWDPATGVPTRIWGSGIAAAGANANPAVAERIARKTLAAHLDLLAPGAAITDFELVANHGDRSQRSVGFVQRASGRRVVGGQVSFRFKNDRLFVIASEALPNVVFAPTTARMKPQALKARATENLRIDLELPNAPVATKGDEVVLPLVADDAVLGYRLATPLEINGGAEGRYLAYVDPATAAVIAVHQQNTYANGTVLYRVVDRHPGKPRIDLPAQRAQVKVGGAPQTTTTGGAITWSPDVAQTVDTAVVGDLVTIVNKSTAGLLATAPLSISPGGSTVWDATAVQEDDAQISTFVATNLVKEYIRANIDPAMPKLDEPMVANVNITQQCNAFFDGETINFFQASMECQNTGLLADVVFHEFGHNLHHLEVIEGVGKFDGAMSEGASDFLAALLTNDPGMGRGFFYTEEPLRQLDPIDDEPTWPRDIGEIHKTGIIFGGTFWDLRKDLIAQLGQVAADQVVNKLFLATLRRSTDIPTSLIEALAEDDDDGNLDNGSPNECAIRTAFGRHGLRTATGVILAPGALDENAAATIVRVDLSGLSERCTGDEIDKITLEWKPGFTPMPRPGTAVMTQVNSTRFWAQMPLAIDGVVYYKALIKFKDGSELTLADNYADPFYTIYQGSTVKLYCTDFENENPFGAGWTTGTNDNTESPWSWGEAAGGATDPPFAYSGGKLVGQTIGGDYAPQQYSYLAMPPIDVGQYSDVRLQYRRWLAVEDSEFDKARVTVNGGQAFVNFTANQGQRSSTHHIDREWRFNDIGVSGYGFGHTINIAWDLQTDEGLQLGGWAIDDVCVVANRNSICGDGVKNLFEQCDDGPANANVPGACRTYCRLPACGDAVIDEIEECDDGPSGSTTCSPACVVIEEDGFGGCCSSSRDARGALALGALVGLLLFRRRRRG
jgi:hypothetical protein